MYRCTAGKGKLFVAAKPKGEIGDAREVFQFAV